MRVPALHYTADRLSLIHIWQNLGAGVNVAPVQTNAVAGAGVIDAHLAGVGHKVVGGVLGGDTGLDLSLIHI